MVDRREEYDPAKLLTLASLWFVGLLIVFVCFIIGWQIATKDEANTESWAALTGLIGWATAKVGDIFSNRFGTSTQSKDKDKTIAQQARTAAGMQQALLDPNVLVTTAGAMPQAKAVLDDPMSTAPVDPIKADTVNVTADTAIVTESKP